MKSEKFGRFIRYSVLLVAFFALLGINAFAKKRHNNRLYFDIKRGKIRSFKVQFGEHRIRRGQPWARPSYRVERRKNRGRITIRAGRKLSRSVAKWFSSNAFTSGSVAYRVPYLGLKASNSTCYPKKLNFAIKARITITYKSGRRIAFDCVIGQGKTRFLFKKYNNWWIGAVKPVGGGYCRGYAYKSKKNFGQLGWRTIHCGGFEIKKSSSDHHFKIY